MNPYYDLIRTYCRPLERLGATVPARIAWSIVSAVIGILLLVLFFSFFMTTAAIVGVMPLIFGFNAAMTGFSLIDKTGDKLPHRMIFAACSGLATVLLAWLVLSFILDFSLMIRGSTLGWYFLTGTGCGIFGGWLAVKTHSLNREKRQKGRDIP